MFKDMQTKVKRADMSQCKAIQFSKPDEIGKFDLKLSFTGDTFKHTESLLNSNQLDSALLAILPSNSIHITVISSSRTGAFLLLPQHIVAWSQTEKYIWTVSGEELSFESSPISIQKLRKSLCSVGAMGRSLRLKKKRS